MYTPDPTIEKRIFVKISICFHRGPIDKVLYFRNDMKLEFFNKWMWFFEYRAALCKVQNPKSRIIYEQGSYDYVLPDAELYDKVKNRYFGAKRNLSKIKNKLDDIRKNYTEMFPIEEHPAWPKNLEKIKYYEDQVDYWKKEFEKLGNVATN